MLDETSMSELLETFLAESEEGLQSAEEALLVLERDPDDVDALALAFRAVHTIKGNAGVFDFHALAAVAHAMEDVLDRIRSGRTRTSQGVMSVLLDAVDQLRTLLFDDDRTRAIGPREQELITRLSAGAHQLRDAAAITHTAVQRATQTLRIDVARLDRLLDLSGEIGVARGRVAQMLEDGSITRSVVLEAQRDADLLHLEMQELVMKLRMVPVGPSFRQLQRTVRDVAYTVGKQAELRIEGGDVEVDMTIVEHLRDPLIHIIRNSIETPEARRAAGKPASGQLVLRSFQESGSIVIELSDDGAGIDRRRIVQRAVDRGMVAEGHHLSESEALDLIFSPGFSTADEVTDLSGRGVGLDVVRRNIDAIHGTVTVQSVAGQGTTFRLRLPLTLAIASEWPASPSSFRWSRSSRLFGSRRRSIPVRRRECSRTAATPFRSCVCATVCRACATAARARTSSSCATRTVTPAWWSTSSMANARPWSNRCRKRFAASPVSPARRSFRTAGSLSSSTSPLC